MSTRLEYEKAKEQATQAALDNLKRRALRVVRPGRDDERKLYRSSALYRCGVGSNDIRELMTGYKSTREVREGERPSKGLTNERRTLVGAVEWFFEQDDKSMLLILSGRGAGKTCALNRAVDLSLEHGRFNLAALPSNHPRYWHAHDVGKSYGYNDPFLTADMKRIRYLALDELGTERDSSESINRIRRVLDHGYSTCKKFVAAGQLTPMPEKGKELRSFVGRYGYNMFERFKQRGVVIATSEMNWRVER